MLTPPSIDEQEGLVLLLKAAVERLPHPVFGLEDGVTVPADVNGDDISRYGDPVFETEDGVWEPFYCSLEQED